MAAENISGRVRWRCRRGMLELDLVLANFLQQYGAGLTVQQWVEFDQLLDLPDQDLWLVLRDTQVADSALVTMLRVNQGLL